MAAFTTRVELHHASTRQDYEDLHTYMEQEGFTRTIKSEHGVTYQLPTAEYNLSGNFTRDTVHGKADSAARRTGKDHAVLVTQSNRRVWSGLSVVKTNIRIY